MKTDSLVFPFIKRTAVVLFCASLHAAEPTTYRLQFTNGAPESGYTAVRGSEVYSEEMGYGFENGGSVKITDYAQGGGIHDHSTSSEKPFNFSVREPEGNYRVTLVLGSPVAESTTTVKAELRRLMLEHIHTEQGKFETKSFIVNVRSPQIAGGGEVKRKAPRETVQEAWAWDDKITLEINGSEPRLCSIVVEPVDVPTIFVMGDSTVTDQSGEPYGSWGQMLPRFFKPVVAVANHGESGETYGSSIGERRLAKVISLIKPGEFVLIQYGTNDVKDKGPEAGPYLNFTKSIKVHVSEIRKHGGVPVLVTPVRHRYFDGDKVRQGDLGEYPEAVRKEGVEDNVPVIDLYTMTGHFYEALGPELSKSAFATPPGGHVDDTHHNNYGSYELAKCIVQGIRDAQLPIANYIVDEFQPFDPAHPDPVEKFDLPSSPGRTTMRPLGDPEAKK